ncbi:hypothetical protein H0H93_008635 [Arthromyces matolae]|nr:hypothetical protein H0H93_008635 [Arthromyces matolae]
MTTNPSHILIARNSRGPHNPSASLSPTETHAAASGIFRSSGSPPWLLQECETDDIESELSMGDDTEEAIDIDEAFTRDSRFPGTVKIVVEGTTFWAHKEVLFFASPFFEAALSGNWSETGHGRPHSMSSVITISQPPPIPGERAKTMSDISTEMTFAPMDPDLDPSELNVISEHEAAHTDSKDDISQSSSSEAKSLSEEITRARDGSLAKLQSSEHKSEMDRQRKRTTLDSSTIRGSRLAHGPDAVIVLKEERASSFHDFLKYVYPQFVFSSTSVKSADLFFSLECTITWNNVESLMNISHKLCVPPLQRDCLTFLLTHAAGKPIKALRIAELFEEEELYREASRFVLDNPGGWSDEEMATLSQETLLKLEKRRTWFLERVLKLGLTLIAKEYQCCATCPEPPLCARLLEEKWKQAYFAVFRFVFDRMFSLGIRGSGADTAPLPGRSAATVAGAASGPRRHFLYCSLRSDTGPKTRRSREGL